MQRRNPSVKVKFFGKLFAATYIAIRFPFSASPGGGGRGSPILNEKSINHQNQAFQNLQINNLSPNPDCHLVASQSPKNPVFSAFLPLAFYLRGNRPAKRYLVKLFSFTIRAPPNPVHPLQPQISPWPLFHLYSLNHSYHSITQGKEKALMNYHQGFCLYIHV